MKKIFFLLLGTVLFLCGDASAAFAAANPPPLLAEAAQNLSVELNRLDDGLGRAAQKLGKSGLTGPEARGALSALCSKFSYAVDCAAVDMQGTMVTLEPAPFRRFEGKNIAGQEQVQRILKTGKPVLSGVFRAVEGFPAIDAEYPVANARREASWFGEPLVQAGKASGRRSGRPLCRHTGEHLGNG
jgi:hypothetical protein